MPGDEALLLVWQLIAYVANDSWFLCFATDSLADSQRVQNGWRQKCWRTARRMGGRARLNKNMMLRGRWDILIVCIAGCHGRPRARGIR